MKILFVEDDTDDIALISAVLKQEDVKLCFAPTFQEALEKIDAFNPDLVVLDLNLTDSIPLLTIQNMNKLNSSRALVILSGDDSSKNILEAKNAGVKDFIPKNILTNGPELMSRLSKVWFAWSNKTNKSVDSSPLTPLAVKQADIVQSELMLMLRSQNEEQKNWKKYVYDEFKELKNSISAGNTINESRHTENTNRLISIEKRCEHTNGDVTTLKAEVTILKDREKAETDAKIKKAIGDQAILNVKDKNIFIPKIKLSYRQWSIIGAICLFFGWSTLSAWAISIWNVLSHIYQVLFGT